MRLDGERTLLIKTSAEADVLRAMPGLAIVELPEDRGGAGGSGRRAGHQQALWIQQATRNTLHMASYDAATTLRFVK